MDEKGRSRTNRGILSGSAPHASTSVETKLVHLVRHLARIAAERDFYGRAHLADPAHRGRKEPTQ